MGQNTEIMALIGQQSNTKYKVWALVTSRLQNVKTTLVDASAYQLYRYGTKVF